MCVCTHVNGWVNRACCINASATRTDGGRDATAPGAARSGPVTPHAAAARAGRVRPRCVRRSSDRRPGPRRQRRRRTRPARRRSGRACGRRPGGTEVPVDQFGQALVTGGVGEPAGLVDDGDDRRQVCAATEAGPRAACRTRTRASANIMDVSAPPCHHRRCATPSPIAARDRRPLRDASGPIAFATACHGSCVAAAGPPR